MPPPPQKNKSGKVKQRGLTKVKRGRKREKWTKISKFGAFLLPVWVYTSSTLTDFWIRPWLPGAWKPPWSLAPAGCLRIWRAPVCSVCPANQRCASGSGYVGRIRIRENSYGINQDLVWTHGSGPTIPLKSIAILSFFSFFQYLLT